VLHQIGIGALGPVFRTYEPTRDRLVAVKVFRLDIVPEQAQALATALGKAASASLFHPSIVEPIAAGVEGTLAYRAEEYVAAESLDVAMRHYAPATLDKVLPFITQLAGAIDFARAAGVGHGALHPRDIFVTPDDARATGFGVIEALEEVGIRAPVRRPYTAPERIEGKAWGTPADVFSLAAITFELLTARRPAGTGTLIGTLPDGGQSAAVHTVLARAMHDEPSQRYTTALAFAAALESVARGHVEAPLMAQTAPVPPPPVPPPPVPPPAPREEPVKHLEPVKPEPQELKELKEPKEPAEPEEPRERVEREEPRIVREPLLFDAGRDDRHERFVDDFPLESAAPPLAFRHEPASEPPEPAEPLERSKLSEPELSVPTVPTEPIEPREPFLYDPPDSSRPAVLPTAIGVVLGLLAGFAGGYFVGSRDRLSPDTTTAAASAPSGSPAAATSAPATAAPPAGAATRDLPGQYSEQKVSPPATTAAVPTEPKKTEPPPVVQEAPPRPSVPAAAGSSGRERPNERTRANGSITVKSTPSRAGVTLNGRWRGRTPMTFDKLPFGHYVVRIVQPGYRVTQEEFTLGPRDADHTYTAKLEPTAAAATRESAASKSPPAPPGGFVGTLFVDSRPRGATVLLDGKKIGVTPLSLGEVAIGSHVVRVELAGKVPWTSTATVTAGQTARLTMSLEDKQ
jgi:serine/threonine-protein kinase